MNRLIKLLKRLFSKLLKLLKPTNPMKEEFLNTGQPFSMAKIREFVNNFKAQITRKTTLQEIFTDAKGNVRQSEFFGKNKLNILLDKGKIGKDILGVRIYYGLAPEDENSAISATGKSSPRLFLVPVGLDGKDIEFDISSLKDTPNGDGLGEGVPQPPFLNP